MKAKLRLGIVGTGAMAEYHTRRFSAIEGVSVAAVVDRDEPRAQIFAANAGIPSIYHDVGQLASSGTVDALAISTRDLWHAEASIEALSRGLPVFCEKTMARRGAEAEAMLNAAAAAGVPALVNFSKRNAGLLGMARDLIVSGQIGRVESVESFYLQDWLHNSRWGDWRTTTRWQWRLEEGQSSHGVLGDLGSHCLDALMFLFGEVFPIACVTRSFAAESEVEWKPEAPAEVAASAMLRCGDFGATLSLSFGARPSVDSFGFHIRGSSGDIVMDSDLSRDELTIISADGEGLRKLKAEKVPSTYERFVTLARGGIDPIAEEPIDFGRGLAVSRLVEALAEMAKEG
jgi:predicted dehydrogenase